MKQRITLTTICFLLTCLTGYAQRTPGKSVLKQINAKPLPFKGLLRPLTEKDLGKDYSSVMEIYKRMATCAENSDPGSKCGFIPERCNTDYCNREICKSKVSCCHEVNEFEFNFMTHGKTTASGDFIKDSFLYVIDGADCNSERIRCSMDSAWFYIERLQTTATPQMPGDTYYSVLLMQAIRDYDDIDYIRVYNGISIGANTQIIPFLVRYTNGIVKYYDLSNEIP